MPRVGDPIGEVKQQAVIQPRAIASGTYDPAGQVHSGGRSLQAAILGEGNILMARLFVASSEGVLPHA